jgi:hypothetical protein
MLCDIIPSHTGVDRVVTQKKHFYAWDGILQHKEGAE